MQERKESDDKRLDDQLAAMADRLMDGLTIAPKEPVGDEVLDGLGETVADLASLGEPEGPDRETADRIRIKLVMEWKRKAQLDAPKTIWERLAARGREIGTGRYRRVNRWALGAVALGLLVVLYLATPDDGSSLSAVSGNTQAWMPIVGVAVVGLVAYLVAVIYRRRD